MSQYAPRTDPSGSLERTCAHCEQPFRTDNPRAKYCSETCKRRAAFQRWYSKPKNRRAVQRRVRRYQKARRRSGSKNSLKETK